MCAPLRERGHALGVVRPELASRRNDAASPWPRVRDKYLGRAAVDIGAAVGRSGDPESYRQSGIEARQRVQEAGVITGEVVIPTKAGTNAPRQQRSDSGVVT